MFDALDVTFDYYVKNTENLLTPVSLPPSAGFSSYTENLGETKNKGVEFKVNYRVLKNNDKAMYLSVFASGMHNKNRITKISDALSVMNNERDKEKANGGGGNPNLEENSGITKPSVRYAEGQSMDAIWAVRSLGIDPATGEEIFIRPDGSITNTWNTNDQVVLGDTEPKIQGTFGLNATYKNLSLYMTFMYEAGGQIYNSTLRDKVEDVNVYTSNVDKRVFSERWQEPGDKARYRKLTSGVGGSIMRTRPTSRFVEDNNVLTLNSISLGYDFDAGQKWMKTIGLSMLRFEIGANDVCRWSSVKVERGLNYPYARSFNFSLKAAF